jgi:hypothetical protein
VITADGTIGKATPEQQQIALAARAATGLYIHELVETTCKGARPVRNPHNLLFKPESWGTKIHRTTQLSTS